MSDTVTIPRAELQRMKRDMLDMQNAARTIFVRCACGRIRESGIICPTVQENGDCEAGR